jgi:hypothetical protein
MAKFKLLYLRLNKKGTAHKIRAEHVRHRRPVTLYVILDARGNIVNLAKLYTPFSKMFAPGPAPSKEVFEKALLEVLP